MRRLGKGIGLLVIVAAAAGMTFPALGSAATRCSCAVRDPAPATSAAESKPCCCGHADNSDPRETRLPAEPEHPERPQPCCPTCPCPYGCTSPCAAGKSPVPVLPAAFADALALSESGTVHDNNVQLPPRTYTQDVFHPPRA